MLIRLISKQALYVQRSAELYTLIEQVTCTYLLSFTRHIYFIAAFFSTVTLSFKVFFICGDYKKDKVLFFQYTLYNINVDCRACSCL